MVPSRLYYMVLCEKWLLACILTLILYHPDPGLPELSGGGETAHHQQHGNPGDLLQGQGHHPVPQHVPDRASGVYPGVGWERGDRERIHSICKGCSRTIQWNLSWKSNPLATKMWSVKTGGLWWQVQLYWNIGPSANIVWSVKTGGLAWQWSLKTDFTVSLKGEYCTCCMFM